MKRSERRVSFNGIQSADLKPLTSAAIRVGSADASNFVIGPTPLTPPRRFFQASATPIPTGETIPSPVTTTFLLDMVSAHRPCAKHVAEKRSGKLKNAERI